jgi:tight adherence protein C
MEVLAAVERIGVIWSPGMFAGLVCVAILMSWMAFQPAPPRKDVRNRLSNYVDRDDVVIEQDMRQPFVSRAVFPIVRSLLRFLGRLLPNRNLEATRMQIQAAGNPGGLTPMDFYGVRVLAILFLAVVAFVVFSRGQPPLIILRNCGAAVVLGFWLPKFWLNNKAKKRRSQVQRALPDALDMLTIGVEAGLAFESAMVRVGEKWNNVLTQEFARAVAEMRVGMSREQALERMAERCHTPELTTFVAVLVQSSQLGVSIAQVLHAQADDMRLRRRQRAEELARQAGIKMIFPLALCILPSLFVVILGPSIPVFMNMFGSVGGGGALP